MPFEETPSNESLGDKVRKLDAKRWEIKDKIETLDVRDMGVTETPNPLSEDESHDLEGLKVEWNETQDQLTQALQQMSEDEQIVFNAPITEEIIQVIDKAETPALLAIKDKVEKGLTHKDLIQLWDNPEVVAPISNIAGVNLEDEVALRRGGRQVFQY